MKETLPFLIVLPALVFPRIDQHCTALVTNDDPSLIASDVFTIILDGAAVKWAVQHHHARLPKSADSTFSFTSNGMV